ncbi:MAG: beta-galactosidase trimerization domain-containing protein, partial [Clostridia bacterium]|nr:beta-galactosidase trimerization domain-containing protein [Clostridia bacterium]
HSQSVISFAREQAEILREICPDHFITHNYMGMHDSIDYGMFGNMLDFVSDDYYYNFDADGWNDRYESYLRGAQSLDFIYGLKAKPFWIMENSAGALGWETYGRNLRPGEMRRMTFQNMAHGAKGQIWFRWRTSLYGTEQYWHGLLDHSGIPARRYKEAAAVSAELQTVYKAIGESRIPAEVAIVTDYEDRWAFAQQPNSVAFNYTEALLPYYRALSARGVNTRFIGVCDALSPYKLVILPYKYILTKEYANQIIQFVNEGGVVLTTCRTGVKNVNNVPHEMVLPGYLRELVGIRVEEYEAIDTYNINYKGVTYQGGILADWIEPESAIALGCYTDQGISYAAVTQNTYGNGKAFYVGVVPQNALADRMIDDVLREACVETFSLPEGTELVTHLTDGELFHFLLNHSEQEQTFLLPGYKGIDLLSHGVCDGAFTVPANGAAVIRCSVLP